MQIEPLYTDVVSEVGAFLRQRMHACADAGIEAGRILLDPGIGFGKRLEHNLSLLARLPELSGLGPIVIGVSRKSMFQQLLGLPVTDRLHASLSAAALAVWQGAAIVRAHDVKATVEAIKVASAIRDQVRT